MRYSLYVSHPLGFGDADRVAEVFGIPCRQVRRRAKEGMIASWVIAGRRVYDLNAIFEDLAKYPELPSIESMASQMGVTRDQVVVALDEAGIVPSARVGCVGVYSLDDCQRLKSIMQGDHR